MKAGTSPMLGIALEYIARGLAVVPISYKQKSPKIKSWEKLKITADNAPMFFNGAEQNIGVQLGVKSNGLADVDLDCAEAVRLAPRFLPRTDAVFGRATKPSSHYLYYIGDAPEKATEQLKDENKQTIIELRMGVGRQQRRRFSRAACTRAEKRSSG
ncbi:bifunctional DNA primase/polymerase [Bradyrhizobium sp. LLZ17]|uniref:Bifunctional DNA primase/polymerase n=1 Tax=Bradyrhizobium sp. LLZ17 TaxID=3239388 RepID=A0AB39XK98_9BRAD